jgi:hypothetical protein
MTGHLQKAASVGGIVSATRRVVNHYSTKIGDLCVRAQRLLRRVSGVGRGAGVLVATSCYSAAGERDLGV